MTQYMFYPREYFMWTSEECVFCCCWVCYRGLLGQVCVECCSSLLFPCWSPVQLFYPRLKVGIEVSNYYCLTVDSSLNSVGLSWNFSMEWVSWGEGDWHPSILGVPGLGYNLHSVGRAWVEERNPPPLGHTHLFTLELEGMRDARSFSLLVRYSNSWSVPEGRRNLSCPHSLGMKFSSSWNDWGWERGRGWCFKYHILFDVLTKF